MCMYVCMCLDVYIRSLLSDLKFAARSGASAPGGAPGGVAAPPWGPLVISLPILV